MVVLVIVGIMLGAVSLNAMQSTRQRLQTEAQRVALLLQMAREEAIVRNRQTVFEANDKGYQFLILNENKWEVITDLDALRGREFSFPETKLSITPNEDLSTEYVRIVFGREPVSKPFVMFFNVGETQVAIHADGVGHFEVD